MDPVKRYNTKSSVCRLDESQATAPAQQPVSSTHAAMLVDRNTEAEQKASPCSGSIYVCAMNLKENVDTNLVREMRPALNAKFVKRAYAECLLAR